MVPRCPVSSPACSPGPEMGRGAAHKQEEVQTGLLGAWQACLTLPYRKWARSAQNRGGSPTSVRSWLEAAAITGQRGRKGQAKLSHEAAPPDPPRTKWIQTQKTPRFLWPGGQVHIPGRLSGRSSSQATMPQPQAEFQAVSRVDGGGPGRGSGCGVRSG